jgi:hypothetical protein
MIALTPFERCVWRHTVAKILHSRQHWQWPIVIFPTMWGVLMAKFRLGCDEVFFLSFLLPLKFMSAFPKNNCVLQFVILSILALILIITILFAFDTFWSLTFFQLHPLVFYSIWFLYLFWSSYFWLLFFVFYILFLIIVFQFCSLSFYCICFFH